MADSDPRVFFAAERTLLAWLRTGLTLIALGFVVSRFGLFIRLFTLQSQSLQPSGRSWLSAALGVAFVVAGSSSIVLAALQHRRFVATLPQADLPHAYSKVFAVTLSLVVGALGLFLAAYLLVSEP